MTETQLAQLKAAHPIREVAKQLGLSLNGSSGKCFKHEDKHPSFVYMPENNRFECKSCSIKGDVIDLVMAVKNLSFQDAVTYLDPSSRFDAIPRAETAQEYLDSRGLTPGTLNKFNIRIENNEVVIPLPTGNKYRMFGKEMRFRQDTGTKATIFKTQDLAKKVILCEGELDAVKLFQETSYPAWSGTSGADTFRAEWVKDFENVEKIFICYDNDEAGRKGTDKVIEVLGTDRCYKIALPTTVKDITEYFQKGYTKQDFDTLLQSARPAKSSILDFVKEIEKPLFEVKAGFEEVDKQVSFEAGNSYLIGGCEKSGKSAFCMNIASYLLTQGHTISYVNTEFTQREFITRMAGIHFNTPYGDITTPQVVDYATKFKETLVYSGIGQDEIEFTSIHQKLQSEIDKGIKIIFFDNVTTFANNPPPKTDGWVHQASVMNSLKDLAKQRNVIVFVVLHTKDVPIERTMTSKIKDIISANDPTQIFDDTVTVMSKPTSANLYGGQRISSQFSGTILIWRPFLKFTDPFFNKTTQIILESFRNAPAGIGFNAEFKGEIPQFEFTEGTTLDETPQTYQKPYAEDFTSDDKFEEVE